MLNKGAVKLPFLSVSIGCTVPAFMKGWHCASSLTAAVEDEKNAKPKTEIYRGQRRHEKGKNTRNTWRE